MQSSMLLQDRDSLGALADSIKVFEGGVIMISHNAGALLLQLLLQHPTHVPLAVIGLPPSCSLPVCLAALFAAITREADIRPCSCHSWLARRCPFPSSASSCRPGLSVLLIHGLSVTAPLELFCRQMFPQSL